MATVILHPLDAKAMHRARPMPEPPPVTRTVLLVHSMGLSALPTSSASSGEQELIGWGFQRNEASSFCAITARHAMCQRLLAFSVRSCCLHPSQQTAFGV